MPLLHLAMPGHTSRIRHLPLHCIIQLWHRPQLLIVSPECLACRQSPAGFKGVSRGETLVSAAAGLQLTIHAFLAAGKLY
jgi:hypothetical protein